MTIKGLDIQWLLVFMIRPVDKVLRVASHWGVILHIEACTHSEKLRFIAIPIEAQDKQGNMTLYSIQLLKRSS